MRVCMLATQAVFTYVNPNSTRSCESMAVPGADKSVAVPGADKSVAVPGADKCVAVPGADKSVAVPGAVNPWQYPEL
jgi:hypothetical protein